MPSFRNGVVEKFLNFLQFREAWQLLDHGSDAMEMMELYERVKKAGGRHGVESAAWVKGVKVVGALTPIEVTDFQQFWLSAGAQDLDFVLGKSAKGGRKRCARQTA